MRKPAIIWLLILVLVPAFAMAAENNAGRQPKKTYFGFGFQYVKSTLNDPVVNAGFPDASTDQLEARLGYFITPNIALEGRLGSSVDRYYLTDHTSPDTYEIENYASAYLRLQTPDFGRYHIYALAGYSTVNSSSSTGDRDDSGASWSAGLAMTLDPGNSLALEYTSIINNDNLKAESIGLVFSYRF